MQDSTRADSPLTCDESYFRIDTSDLSIDECRRCDRRAGFGDHRTKSFLDSRANPARLHCRLSRRYHYR